MAQEQLQIVLTAETDQAAKDISNVTKQLSTLEKTAAVASKSFGAVSKGAANATPALTNFGRVIQDAPFGIIGIANNIDPLISSLQSLSKQTGGAGGAFKALGAGLLGPAGIAIGVSAATSALIAFGPAIGRAISGVSDFENAQRAAAEEGAKAFAKAADNFSNFVRLASDGEASTARQNDAFEKANKLLADYGLQIENLAAFQQQGAKIGALYAQIKQEEAKASLFAGKAAEAYAKSVALGTKIEQGDFFGVLGEFSTGDLIQTLTGDTNLFGSLGFAVTGVTNAFSKANTEEANFNKESAKSRATIDTLIASIGKVDGVTEKFGKSTKTTAAATVTAKDSFDKYLASFGTFTTGQQKAVLLTNQETAGLIALSKAADAVAASKTKANLADKQKALGGTIAPVGAVNRGLDPAILAKQAEAATIAANATAQAATAADNAQVAYGLLSPAIDGVFNALSADDPFKALIQGLKAFVVEIIKAIAKALILKALTAAFSGGTGILGGALGGLLGFSGRANGGPVGAGSPYMVGEAGPELFVPNTSGSIVPNMALAGGGGTLSATIRGNDLLFILEQSKKSFNRNFG